MTLTLQKCESYLFDSEVLQHKSSLKGISLNSTNLLPSKLDKQMQLYTLKDDRLLHKGEMTHDFKHMVRSKNLDPAKCFVIELTTDPFSKRVGNFHYLICLDAPFLDWDKALLVKKDPTTNCYTVEQTSDHSDFLSMTYFRRFAAFFPHFLISEGVMGVFPVIAIQSV